MEDVAIKFEAQLVSASMSAAGGHKITLRISPEDIMDNPANTPSKSIQTSRVRSLMLQQPNTRFVCALVQLADESDDVVEPQDVTDARKVSNMLSMLCRTDEEQGGSFRDWLKTRFILDLYDSDGFDELGAGEQALKIVKEAYGFSSRKDLFENQDLTRNIARLIEDYRTT